MIDYVLPRYQVRRDAEACVGCDICVRECANGVHIARTKGEVPKADHVKCVNCLRCVLTCPTRAPVDRAVAAGGRRLGGGRSSTCRTSPSRRLQAACCSRPWETPNRIRLYWDHLLLNASQVTNPSIYPARAADGDARVSGRPSRCARDRRAPSRAAIALAASGEARRADHVLGHELRVGFAEHPTCAGHGGLRARHAVQRGRRRASSRLGTLRRSCGGAGGLGPFSGWTPVT